MFISSFISSAHLPNAFAQHSHENLNNKIWSELTVLIVLESTETHAGLWDREHSTDP